MSFRFKARILLLLFARTGEYNYEIAKHRPASELCHQTVCCFCTVSAVNEGYRRSRLGRSLKLNELATKKGHGPTNFATSFAFSSSLFLSISLSLSYFFFSSFISPRCLTKILSTVNIFAACVRCCSHAFAKVSGRIPRGESRTASNIVERAITGDAVSFSAVPMAMIKKEIHQAGLRRRPGGKYQVQR